jgi:hypothetical protein
MKMAQSAPKILPESSRPWRSFGESSRSRMLPVDPMSLARAFFYATAIAAPFFIASSCGGPSPPLQAPAVKGHSGEVPSAPPPPDLSAVRDPAALVVFGRFAKPGASLAIVRAWAKVAVPLSEEVTELLTGEAVGPLVDLDQPIDFAVAVVGNGPRTRDETAASAALKDADRARASLSERHKLVPLENGALLVQGLGRSGRRDDDQGSDDLEDEHRVCELAPAYGAVATRLVCAVSLKALAELAPWLTRTAARVTTTSDLHLELRMQPLRSTISTQKRLIASLTSGLLGARLELSSSRELLASVGGDLVDFALDLDTASLDINLGDPVATATAALRFSATTSALARFATAHPERAAPAPSAFWQLPGDADFAFFDRGIDEAELTRARELVLRVVGEGLTNLGLKDADQRPILDALGKITSSASVAYASGLDADAVTKALASEKSLHDGSDPAALAEAERALAEALFGWRVIELDEPSARLASAVKELAAAWAKPTVVAAIRAKGKGNLPPALRAVPMPKGTTLPAGSQHYALELRPSDSPVAVAGGASAPKPKVPTLPGKPISIHLLIVADGARTWLGFGGGEALVASKLAAAIGATGDKLVSRAELASLKSASIGTGGFVTARGLPEAAQPVNTLLGGSMSPLAAGFDELAQLPHRGSVPMTFSLTARPNGSPAEVTASLEVPRGAIEDIATEITRHGF